MDLIKELEGVDIPLFKGVRMEDLRVMLLHLEARTADYKKDEIILMEQERVRYIGIVLKGRVDMVREDFWGEETFLAYISEGELFGETFAVMQENSSGATFRAAQDSKILFLSLDHVMHPCMRQCPFHMSVESNLFDLLGRKAMQLMDKTEIVSKPDLRGKILAYLSLQAQKQKSKYLEVPLGREEMAQYLCANRSALSRELGKLKEEGIIDYHRNTFVIRKNPYESGKGEQKAGGKAKRG